MREPDVSVATTVARDPDVVWTAVADPERIAAWSPEARGARTTTAGPLTVGARFTGSNANRWWRWSTQCVVVESRQGSAFAFDVTYLGLAVARWRYPIAPTGEGSVVTEEWWERRGPLVKAVGIVGTGVVDRRAHNAETMRQTLAALKADLEAASGSGDEHQPRLDDRP